MAEPVDPWRGGGDGSDEQRVGAWPSQPSIPPSAPPSSGPDGDTATEPGLARTDELLPAPTTESPAPFFHDVAGPPPPGSGPFGPDPAYGQPAGPGYGQPGYPPPPYGYPGYGGSAYGPYAYGAYAPPKSNGLAIASMVCGIGAFVLCQIFAIPGLILGLRARRQIRESGGAETGDAFALAGIVLSSIGLVLLVVIVAIYVVLIGLAVGSGV